MSPADDAKQSARHMLREASIDLEALRPQALSVTGGTYREDDSIRNAWSVALDRYRVACLKYVEAMT